MSSMYEVLMDLPLFQGVSHTKISELIEKIRFNFLKYLNNEKFISANEYLFGKTTAYPYNVYAEPEAGILQIEKSDYLKIIKSDSVFLFNMLNYVAQLADTYGSRFVADVGKHRRTSGILDYVAHIPQRHRHRNPQQAQGHVHNARHTAQFVYKHAQRTQGKRLPRL